MRASRGDVAEQRPLAAVHFTAFSIHGSIGPVLTQVLPVSTKEKIVKLIPLCTS